MARYSDSVQNAFSEVKAWRSATFILGALVALLSIANIYSRMHAPTYLVPYNFATLNKQVMLQPGAYDPEYVQALAFQDTSLLLTWTADTVTDQYNRFMRRMTSELHASQSVKLMAEADSNTKSGYSQAFYPGKSIKISGLEMIIPGELVRWQGPKEIFRQKLTYTIRYRESGQGLLLDDIDFKQGEKS